MPRKKPHPRSLDALFGKPKRAGPRPLTVPKKPVPLCPAGHRQSSTWKAGNPCLKCHLIEAERIRALNAKAEKDEWSRRLNVGPVLTHLVVSTGRVVRHAIPPHLQRRRCRQTR